MVKILNFNCVRNFSVTTGYCVYVFFDLHLFGFSLEVSIFSIKLPCKYRQLMFFLDIDSLPLCISSTIFLPMVTLWQPLKNKNLLRPNQPELWKTTLNDKNLSSLTSKILGSYMWVFTVLQYNIQNIENNVTNISKI